MKKLFLTLSILAALTLSGCFANAATHSVGLITDVSGPVTATGSTTAPTKKGTAKMTNILGIFAAGDASIQKACQEAGITEIHHVDYESTGFLGIYASYTVIVYGN